MSELLRLLEGKRVLITCGAGGVGKTTSAAAIACLAARSGRKTAVLTVDPARRLARSLGLSAFSGEAACVPLPGEAGKGSPSFEAMMLDNRSTFDRLVQRYAPSVEQAQAIMNNPFYRHFTGAVGGAHEYGAMERLYEIMEQGRHDLIVLDTPPTVHALDFLDAPQKLIDAFDESVFRWVIKPYLVAGKVGLNVLSFGSNYIYRTLTRFVGGEMIRDLSEFLRLFQGMFEGFRERAQAVQALLHDERTGFLVVTTPEANALKDAAVFLRELSRMDLPFAGFLFNRVVREEGLCEPETLFSRLAEAGENFPPDFVMRMTALCERQRLTSARQWVSIARFVRTTAPQAPWWWAPLFARDIADTEGLLALAESVSLGVLE